MLTLKTNKVFLLNLLDETMPGITNILPLTTRTPETSLSVLFINRFKSYDRIKKMGKSRFLDAFEKIARKSRNRQTKTYGLAIYEAALRNITTLFTLIYNSQVFRHININPTIIKIKQLSNLLVIKHIIRQNIYFGEYNIN